MKEINKSISNFRMIAYRNQNNPSFRAAQKNIISPLHIINAYKEEIQHNTSNNGKNEQEKKNHNYAIKIYNSGSLITQEDRQTRLVGQSLEIDRNAADRTRETGCRRRRRHRQDHWWQC